MRQSNAATATIVFFILAPGIVAGLVPWLITDWALPTVSPYFAGFQIGLGAVIIAGSLFLLIDSFTRLVTEGNGTPMPWMPTTRMVVRGAYRYFRNPMYVGVIGVILAQAILFGSVTLLLYGTGVWLVFHLFVVLAEEPGLRRSYGDAYGAYSAGVPRWLPRIPPPSGAS